MNKKEKALFLGHFILLLLELLVVLHAFSEEGWTTLRFYTTDSNFLCGIASLLYILRKFPKLNQEGKGVVSGYFQKKQQAGISLEEERPSLITLLRFISTASLMVTFVVVLLVLGPENGYAHEFLGGMRLYSHLICPFLSLFLFVTGEERVPKKWISALCHSLNSSQCDRSCLRAIQLLKDSGAKLRKDDVLDCDDFIWKCAPCLGSNRLTRFASRNKETKG